MKKLRKKVLATSTEFGNLDPLYVEESDTTLLNHQSAGDLLIDPSDEPENLHESITASLDDEDEVLDDDLLEDMPEDGIAGLDDEEPEIDADLDDPLEEEEDGLDPIAVLSEVGETDVEPQDLPEQKTLDTKEQLNKTQDQENTKTDVQREGTKPTEASAKKKVKADEHELKNNQSSDSSVEVDSNFEMPLVDVDNIADDVDDVMFASIDRTKVAIHSNRIIATLDNETAVQVNVEDEYMSDEFDEATIAECKQKGLRAGLRSMGFTLATVKFNANKQIQAKVKAENIAFRKSQIDAFKARQSVMAQCFAIASTGLNRNAFTDFANPLRNELEAKLKIAGVRDASRIVRAAFEKCGIEYTKTLMAAAEKISELPEDSRNGLLASLDMTQEPDEDEGEEIGADPSLYGDPVDGECDSIEAALLNPIKAKVSVTAASKPISFGCY